MNITSISNPMVGATNSTPSSALTTSTPLEEEDFDNLFGDTRYSQVATQEDELVQPSTTSTVRTSHELTGPSAASSQSSIANPLSPLANRSTTSVAQAKPIQLDVAFRDATRVPFKFCYDMAHRSVLALKANSITARLHGPGARGIEAPSVSETIVSSASTRAMASL